MTPATRSPKEGGKQTRTRSAVRDKNESSLRAGTLKKSSIRRRQLIEHAARLFGKHGFDKTTMRDIAEAFGVLPGSLYHHFRSKSELFVAVYTAGVDQTVAAVENAIVDIHDPWAALEAACIAHLNQLLSRENPMAAVLAGWSTEDPTVRAVVIAQRDRYERLIRRLVDAVDLPDETNRVYFRLALLGALNWAFIWYRPGGERPDVVAKNLVAVFRPKMMAAKIESSLTFENRIPAE